MALHVISYSLTRGSAQKAGLRVVFIGGIPAFSLLALLVAPLLCAHVLHAQSPAPDQANSALSRARPDTSCFSIDK